MRYTISINQVKTREWGLNMNEGALMDLINQASSWANPVVVGDEVYYWVSRNMVVAEIPLAYSKVDTVYRAFKDLAEKGLIDYVKKGKRDLIKLTKKGKTWNVKNSEINPNTSKNTVKNSEINPNLSQKLGNKSEKTPQNSEMNPTNKNTSNPNTNNQSTRENTQTKKSKSSATEKSKTQKPKVKPPAKLDDLIGFGVDPQVASDFLKKHKNQQITQTALTRNRNQAKQAGLTLAQAITYATERGWVAFTAEYYFNRERRNQNQSAGSQSHENHQSANSQPKSKAEQYRDMLNQQYAERYGQPQPTERTVN